MVFKKILVPVDFNAPSKRALAFAIDLAKQYAAELVLVHVWEVPAYAYAGIEYAPVDLLGSIHDAAKAQLETMAKEVQRELPRTTAVLRNGAAWREICAVIEQAKPDLVVIGTHGRHGAARALLGSVAEKIVRMSPVPVLTVRGEAS